MIGLSYRANQVPGPSLKINCPACGQMGIWGSSYDEVYEMRAIFFSVNCREYFSYVKCTNCGENLTSVFPISYLEPLDADSLEEFLYFGPNGVCVGLAVASLLLSPLPIVGPALALLAMAVNAKFTRTLCISALAFVVSCVLTLIWFISIGAT